MAELQRQGPPSFSIESDAPVASAAVPQIGAPTAQAGAISPGLSAQAPGVSDADSKTFQAILGLSSGLLAPKIKEAQQEQYIQGVQQAMTGESLGEIIKDKPWYTDIFAPSSALIGARTYTAQKAIADWGAKMAEQMPSLARQGPEQLQSAAVGAMQGFMTGDAQADSMITAAVTEQMAPLFKQHAKEHYVYVQKQATEAQVGAWESLGKVYQSFAGAEASGKGMVSPDDLNGAKARFLAAVTPFADQSDESFERNIAAFIAGSATAGNFQVVKLFKETGLYDKIDPDKRAVLDRSLMAAGRETLNKAMPTFAVDVATLVNDMAQDPRGIPDKVAALNAKARAFTGVSEQDLIPLGALDNIVGRVMVAQQHEAEARRRASQSAAEKDAEKLGEIALAASQLQMGPGHVDACVAMGLCKEQAVEKAGALAYGAAKGPAERAAVLNARTNKAFDAIKSTFTATLRAPEYQKGVGEMSQLYAALSDNVKPQYFDEHERALMDRFNTVVRSGTPPEAAWIVAKTAPSLASNTIRPDAKDALSKAIRSEVESKNESAIFHINDVDESSLRTIEAVTMRAAKLDHTNNPADVAAKRAYAQARANGLDIMGKHAVVSAVVGTNKPLSSLIGESAKGTAEAFEELMAESAKAQGSSLDNYLIIRTPDRGNAAYFQIEAHRDGEPVYWTLSSEQVKARVLERVKKSLEHPVGQAPTAPVIGPEGAAFGVVPRP